MRAFKIDQPGVYQISASYARGDSSPEVVPAVGKSFSDGSKMWNNAMLYLASIILGMDVMILTLSRGKRRSNDATKKKAKIPAYKLSQLYHQTQVLAWGLASNNITRRAEDAAVLRQEHEMLIEDNHVRAGTATRQQRSYERRSSDR